MGNWQKQKLIYRATLILSSIFRGFFSYIIKCLPAPFLRPYAHTWLLLQENKQIGKQSESKSVSSSELQNINLSSSVLNANGIL